MQKYKLIEDQVIEFEYHKLYRIEAVRDFGRIKKRTTRRLYRK